MKYACLIYSDEANTTANPDPTSEAMAEMMAGYQAFGEAHGQDIQAGEALASISTATTVQVADGNVVTTDGPFAETKEQLGGFYVIDVPDLDAAIAAAAKIPHAAAGMGRVEVRPVLSFD